VCSTRTARFGIIGVDQHRDLDLAGADRLDVDAPVAQRLEHARGNPGIAAHADPDRADLHDIVVGLELVKADRRLVLRSVSTLWASAALGTVKVRRLCLVPAASSARSCRR
jgi:hypothetical protein